MPSTTSWDAMNRSERPAISICIPNYNKARFLPQTLECIRRQSFTNYEVVIVDSASTDGSQEILNAFVAQEPRAKLHQHPRGLYGGWNRCIQEATGTWIYFAPSDDFMTDDCLATLAKVAAETDAEIVTSRLWEVDADGRTKPERAWKLKRWLMGRTCARGPLDVYAEFRAGLLIGTPTNSITQLLIHRTVFERVGPFPTDLGTSGDFLWQMRALLCCRHAFVPQRLGAWRRYAEQATTSDLSTLLKVRRDVALRLNSELDFPSDPRTQAAFGSCVGLVAAAEETAPKSDRWFELGYRWAKKLRGWLHPYLAALLLKLLPTTPAKTAT